jgi:tetratricopeptide (TPR) repeat protein
MWPMPSLSAFGDYTHHRYASLPATIGDVQALVARDWGDFRQARQSIEESLSRLDSSEEPAMIAQCRHFLGELALLQGCLAEARAQLEESLQLCQKVGILRRVAATQRLLGDVARAEGQNDEAGKLYQQAIATAMLLGDRP